MNTEENVNRYRLQTCFLIAFTALCATGILCVTNHLPWTEVVAVFFMMLGLIPFILFEMIFERPRGMIGNNIQTNYKRVAIGFILSACVMLPASFMPEFYRPVMLMPLVMIAFSNEILGYITAMFFNVLLAVTTGGSFYELLTYSVLIIIAGSLTKVLKETPLRLWISILLFWVSNLFPAVFYFLTNEKITYIQLLFGAMNGLIVGLYAFFIYPKSKEKTIEEIHYQYLTLLSDDFPTIKELKIDYPQEYLHAKRASNVAYKYAKKLELQPELSAVAAFYYRLGRIQGEPHVENGIKKARELCFPEELVLILSEYAGEQKLPSTPESALVHIVDSGILKLEVMEAEIGKSEWNREMLIYQTLNTLSASGLYDKSGLSINAFIKIRQWLAKEELTS